jgi:tetratricopeptide (TPR) repeat protein
MLVMPLGITGLILSASRSRPSLGILLLLAGYAISLVPFHINGRYRLPFAVALLPFAALCIGNLVQSVKRKQLAAASLLIILLTCLALIPVPGGNDRTAYFNIHAWMLSQQGREAEAIEFWKESSSLNGTFSPFADLALARSFLQAQQHAKALAHLTKIPDDSFAAASKHELLGDLWRHQGVLPDAISEYERSIQVNSGKLQVRRKLIEVLEAFDKARAFREWQALKEMQSLYESR